MKIKQFEWKKYYVNKFVLASLKIFSSRYSLEKHINYYTGLKEAATTTKKCNKLNNLSFDQRFKILILIKCTYTSSKHTQNIFINLFHELPTAQIFFVCFFTLCSKKYKRNTS